MNNSDTVTKNPPTGEGALRPGYLPENGVLHPLPDIPSGAAGEPQS